MNISFRTETRSANTSPRKLTQKYYKLVENASDVESLLRIARSFQESSLPQPLFFWKVASKFMEIEANCSPKDLFRLKSFLLLATNEPLLETMISTIGSQIEHEAVKQLIGSNMIDIVVS